MISNCINVGYQVFGNYRRNESNFLDFRTVIEDEGGIFLGIFGIN